MLPTGVFENNTAFSQAKPLAAGRCVSSQVRASGLEALAGAGPAGFQEYVLKGLSQSAGASISVASSLEAHFPRAPGSGARLSRLAGARPPFCGCGCGCGGFTAAGSCQVIRCARIWAADRQRLINFSWRFTRLSIRRQLLGQELLRTRLCQGLPFLRPH